MFRYTNSQLPRTNEKPVIMPNLKGTDTNEIFNNEVNQFNYRPVMMESSERSHYFKKPEKNPLVPSHPLDRYSSNAYFDPNFESLEYDRLAFRANLPRAIDSGVKNKSGYNIMVDANGEDDYKSKDELRTGKQLYWNKYHQFSLNNEAGQSFDNAYQGLHEENRYAINDVYGSENKAFSHRIVDPNITAKPLGKRAEIDDFNTFHFSSDNVERPLNIAVNGYNSVQLQNVPL